MADRWCECCVKRIDKVCPNCKDNKCDKFRGSCSECKDNFKIDNIGKNCEPVCLNGSLIDREFDPS